MCCKVVAILGKVFSKPAKVKYGNIHLLGILLSALYRYHPAFVVKVIDNVVESVSLGLEQNDFRFFQRRVAEVKYLGELYNYRMLEHPVIFDTLYKIVTFGYGLLPLTSDHDSSLITDNAVKGGPPVPGRYNRLIPQMISSEYGLLPLFSRPAVCILIEVPRVKSWIISCPSFK